jgi:hypothetical protein
MTEITLKRPSDVLEDLKCVVLKLGFADYQPLIKAYIGQCLRKDLELLEEDFNINEQACLDDLAKIKRGDKSDFTEIGNVKDYIINLKNEIN